MTARSDMHNVNYPRSLVGFVKGCRGLRHQPTIERFLCFVTLYVVCIILGDYSDEEELTTNVVKDSAGLREKISRKRDTYDLERVVPSNMFTISMRLWEEPSSRISVRLSSCHILMRNNTYATTDVQTAGDNRFPFARKKASPKIEYLRY